MEKVVIIYHNDCFDGFGGAWVAWKKFGSTAEYIGVEHHELPPKNLNGKFIYFIDFTYSAREMRAIKNKARRVVALDHHISHAQALQEAHEHKFSLAHSGCMLAWLYFYPNKKPPLFLESVEDHDLYVFKKPHTREIISYLGLVEQNFKAWDDFFKAGENRKKRERIIANGAMLLKAEQRMIDKTSRNAMPVEFEGYRTLAINSPVYYSELANEIYRKLKKPFGISWYYRDNALQVSLRSNGKIDVSKIAVKYGGGGHRGAAGFVLPLKKGFPWKFL